MTFSIYHALKPNIDLLL
ncbi:hypothetical protein BAL199_01224 [alpha proteobacterium BAL199]|nr:hypothetical protein BAL199_01224 [alpha proteobacterium BAL199]